METSFPSTTSCFAAHLPKLASGATKVAYLKAFTNPLQYSNSLLRLLRPLWHPKCFQVPWCCHAWFRPPKKDDDENYRYAPVMFGKVESDKPDRGSKDDAKESKMLLKHVRIPKITHDTKAKPEVKKAQGSGPRTGEERGPNEEILKEDDKEIIIERMLVMVKTNWHWVKDAKRDDCEPGHENHFPL
ncbi:hypothetical protein CR513_27174, partial [Mucuna pruriens]